MPAPSGVMQVVAVSISALRLAEYNPRSISKHDYEALKKSIRVYGFIEPIVINAYEGRENVVIGGHQRVRAATELKIGEIPAMVVSVPIEREKALNIALNRIHGEFVEDMLAELLKTIEPTDASDLTGLKTKETDRLLCASYFDPPQEDEFKVDEALGQSSETKPGEILELGPHRIACGDARDPALLKTLMGGGIVDAIFTDPPYNVAYQGGRLGGILNDAQAPEQFQKLITESFTNAFSAVKPGGIFYICMGWSTYPALMEALKPTGVHLANVILWVKETATLNFTDYKYKHEVLVKGNVKAEDPKANVLAYGWKNGAHYFAPIHDETDVWFVRRRHARAYAHPTQKPVALIARALHNSTRKGETVLDPFGGSGSTMIAAELSGRVARIIELDPRFCDVMKRRYEKFIKERNGNGSG